MTDLGYLVWLVATAIVTITVLTVGTLAAAGLLPRRRRTRDPRPTADGSGGSRAGKNPEPTPHEHQRAA